MRPMLRRALRGTEDGAITEGFNSMQGFLFALRAHCGRDARGPSICVESAIFALSLFGADGIEEERVSGQRLAAVLWAKAEENNAAFAQRDFNQRGFSFDEIPA